MHKAELLVGILARFGEFTGRLSEGKRERKGRARLASIDRYCTSVLGYYAVDEGESEAGAVGLGGEERDENLLEVLARDAGTIVVDDDFCGLSVGLNADTNHEGEFFSRRFCAIAEEVAEN